MISSGTQQHWALDVRFRKTTSEEVSFTEDTFSGLIEVTKPCLHSQAQKPTFFVSIVTGTVEGLGMTLPPKDIVDCDIQILFHSGARVDLSVSNTSVLWLQEKRPQEQSHMLQDRRTTQPCTHAHQIRFATSSENTRRRWQPQPLRAQLPLQHMYTDDLSSTMTRDPEPRNGWRWRYHVASVLCISSHDSKVPV